MKIQHTIYMSILLAFSLQVKGQDFDDIGKAALSTNPLMPIMKGIPVTLDVRTGPVIHDFRYCYFWKHNSSTFYDVFDPLNEKVSFKVGKAMEAGYALKIPISIVDNSSFLVYAAPQFLYSKYEYSALPLRFLLKNSNTQIDQEVSGKLTINRYMGMLGMMIFPRRGFFLDAYISLGMRKFKAEFNEKITGTQNPINQSNVDFVNPEKIGEVFFGGSGRLSMQSGFRLGIAL